jgi:16S rRNA (cytosine967-C5)-methyltransferase
LSELGAAETEALLAADNESAPTVLRVNRLRASRPRLLEQLERAGLRVRASAAAPDAVVLESGADPAALPGFAGGEFSSEGEASQLVTLMVGAHPGDQVLDACAAPGGKATYLAEQMENRGHVLAVDVNRIGLDHLVQAAGRLGIDCIEAAVGDAADRDVTGGRSFDRVLLDAPCSGLGTLRQHPEIRWRRSPETLIQAAKGQLRLLRALVERVRPGGTLTYATCTLVRVENDDVVGAFLHDHPGFAIDEPASLPAAVQPYVDAGGVLRTWPHRDGLDVFFAVRLKRRG